MVLPTNRQPGDTITAADLNAIATQVNANIGGAAGTFALTVAANDAPQFQKDVADYQCDGTADEVQIQAAIDALPTTGGTVQLSDGVFNVAAMITIANHNQRLLGMGRSSRQGASHDGRGTRLLASGTLSGNPMIRVQATANTQPLHGCQIRDLTVDGNNQTATGDGIHWRSYRSRIDGVHVVNMGGHGINANGYLTWDLYDAWVTHSQISKCGGSGLYWNEGATDMHVVSCVIWDNLHNFQLFGGGSVQVTGCHFYNATNHNIWFNGSGSRSKFSNCKIEGAGWNGVRVDGTNDGYSDIQFTGCNLASNTRGLAAATALDTNDVFYVGGTNTISRVQIVGCSFTTKSADQANNPRYFVNLDGNSVQGGIVAACAFGSASHYNTGTVLNNSNGSNLVVVTANYGV